MPKIIENFLIYVALISVANGQFMQMNTADMIVAYIDANIDTIGTILATYAKETYPVYNSTKCFNQIKYLSDSVKTGEMWALKVIDSWAKPPAGLTSGNIRELGHFDLCVGIRQDASNPSTGIFQGQYCLTPFNPTAKNQLYKKLTGTDSIKGDVDAKLASSHLPSISLGVCIPATCKPGWWKTVLNSYLKKVDMEVGPYIEELCQTNDPPEVTTEIKYSIGFFSLILTIVLISTIYEMIAMKLDCKPNRVMTIFSAITNGKAIFKLSKQKKPDQIECLNGLRFLAIFWIIIAHRQTYSTREPVVNLITFLEWQKTIVATLVFSSSFAVDIFLLMSGFLLVWTMLKELDRRKGRVNLFLAILNRYLRLTPPVMAMILFTQTILYFMGTGPIWRSIVGGRMSACKEYRWLSTLTYLQNYLYTNTENCTPETWYLAVDFQTFFVSIFIAWGMWKWKKPVVGALLIPIGISIGSTAYLVIKHKFILNYTASRINEYMDIVLNPTHNRMAAYFIGMIYAYAMYRLLNKKFYIPRGYLVITWITAIAGLLFGPYAIYTSLNYPEEDSLQKTAFYQSCMRTVLSASVGWIIFACHFGYGGLLNTILSHRFWQPLARLSYCIYLVHLNVQTVLVGKIHTAYYLDNVFMMHRSFGDLGFSLIAATILSLMFEMPMVQVLKLVFKPAPKKPLTEKSDESRTPNLILSDKVLY